MSRQTAIDPSKKEVLQKYNDFCNLIADLESHFVQQSKVGYTYFPPDNYDLEQKIQKKFLEADEEEQNLIFGYMLIKFSNCLKHWTTNLDQIYPRNGKLDWDGFPPYFE